MLKVCLKQPGPFKGQQKKRNWKLNSLHCDLFTLPAAPGFLPLFCLPKPFSFLHSPVVTSTYFSLPPGFHCSQFFLNPCSPAPVPTAAQPLPTPAPISSPIPAHFQPRFSLRFEWIQRGGTEETIAPPKYPSLSFPEVTRTPGRVLLSPASGDASSRFHLVKVGTAAAGPSIQPLFAGREAGWDPSARSKGGARSVAQQQASSPPPPRPPPLAPGPTGPSALRAPILSVSPWGNQLRCRLGLRAQTPAARPHLSGVKRLVSKSLLD